MNTEAETTQREFWWTGRQLILCEENRRGAISKQLTAIDSLPVSHRVLWKLFNKKFSLSSLQISRHADDQCSPHQNVLVLFDNQNPTEKKSKRGFDKKFTWKFRWKLNIEKNFFNEKFSIIKTSILNGSKYRIWGSNEILLHVGYRLLLISLIQPETQRALETCGLPVHFEDPLKWIFRLNPFWCVDLAFFSNENSIIFRRKISSGNVSSIHMDYWSTMICFES